MFILYIFYLTCHRDQKFFQTSAYGFIWAGQNYQSLASILCIIGNVTKEKSPELYPLQSGSAQVTGKALLLVLPPPPLPDVTYHMPHLFRKSH